MSSMVAAIRQTLTNASPSVADRQSPFLVRGGLVRFTVDDVLTMIRQGILPEDSTVELLNGLVVLKDRSDLGEDPLMHGPKHRMCIRLLTAWASRIETPNRHAQIQLPIVCGGDEMPGPDFALLRGNDRDYAERLPTNADVFLVAEAADSSLERDQIDKLDIYARSGIAHYLILNLRNATIECFSDPDQLAGTYRVKKTVRRDESFYLPGGPDGDVEIRGLDILPEAVVVA